MKQNDTDALLEKLIRSTRSPRGRYSAAESYKILEKRLPGRRPARRWLQRSMAIAATTALLCLMGWMAHSYLLPVKMQTISTLAERRTFRLPDGSEITLNHFSTLTYPERFRGKERKVTLTGEGYFEVSRQPEHPFIVLAEAVSVEVLGTHFNVEAYRNNPEIRTSLLEGSVAVSNLDGTERILLRPNESAIYNKVKKTLDLEQSDAIEEAVAWCNGQFIFTDLPLEEIARRLSNSFGTEIVIAGDALRNYRLTARFDHQESLEEILALLQQGREFTHRRNGQRITLFPKEEKAH